MTPNGRRAGHRQAEKEEREREKNQSDALDERDEEVECVSEEITPWLNGFRSKAGLRGNEKCGKLKGDVR